MWARAAFVFFRDRLANALQEHGEGNESAAMRAIADEWDAQHGKTDPAPAIKIEQTFGDIDPDRVAKGFADGLERQSRSRRKKSGQE